LNGAVWRATNNRMDKSVRVYHRLDEMKADEYRYWQSRPVHERMDAVSELTTAAYALKGMTPDVPRLQGPVVRLPRPQR
jgi:hypothetical protein